MKLCTAILRREWGGYIHSPVAYVAMTLFVLAAGIAFLPDFTPGQPEQMRHTFEWMIRYLVVVIPLLSMGLLAQEFSSGTIESLLTAPVGETDVVLGKFLGSMAFFLVLIAPTFVYVIMLQLYGRPDYGPILSGYLGVILAGALFISIGLFCSSLTRSQMIAAISAMAILFVVTVVPDIITRITTGKLLRGAADQCVFHRYEDFSQGVIDSGNIIFFVAGAAVFLFLTVKSLEWRRWK
jgi:ABC-2 type transport system permease protein